MCSPPTSGFLPSISFWTVVKEKKRQAEHLNESTPPDAPPVSCSICALFSTREDREEAVNDLNDGASIFTLSFFPSFSE
jgi:hypothetical protein